MGIIRILDLEKARTAEPKLSRKTVRRYMDLGTQVILQNLATEQKNRLSNFVGVYRGLEGSNTTFLSDGNHRCRALYELGIRKIELVIPLDTTKKSRLCDEEETKSEDPLPPIVLLKDALILDERAYGEWKNEMRKHFEY